MFCRAHFHDGIFHRHDKRDCFAGYGSSEAVDMASTFRGSGDLDRNLNIVSQQSRVDIGCQHSLSTSAPCLPLLPPVFGEEAKMDCCAGVTKELRKQYLHLSYSNRFKKTESKIRAAKTLKDCFSLGHIYYSKELVHRWMVELAKTVGNKLRVEPYCPPVNSSFTGGCLSNFTWPSSSNSQSKTTQYLCYPGGFGEEEVAVTALQDFCENETLLQVQTRSLLTSVSSRVKQICSQTIADKVFIGVRCDDDTHMFCGQPDNNQSLKITESHHKRWESMKPTSVALSEFVPGEALISGNNGDCFLLDYSGRLVHSVQDHQPAFHNVEPWHHSHFGSHPRQVLLTESTSVTLYDIRGSSVKEGIFQLPHNQFHPLERITVASPYKNNTSYYMFATQASLVLADLRFPNHMVLKWSHNLPAAPAYLSVVDAVTSDMKDRCQLPPFYGSTEDVILMGTQEENEVQAFSLSVNQPPPVKTSLPWALSRPRDIMGFGLASELVEPLQMEKRLTSSLCGLTGARHPNGDGFTAFTITAMGDVFYQTFKPGAPNKEKSWRHGPGSDHLQVPDWTKNKCIEWTNQCQHHKDVKVLAAAEMEAQADLKEKTVLKQRGKKILHLDSSGIAPRKELAHVLCWLCMRQLQDEEVDCSSQSDQTCCACDMLVRDGYYISDVIVKNKVMHKTTKPKSTLEGQLGKNNLEIPNDPYSQILLKLWEEDEPDVTDLVQEREDLIKKAVEERKQQRVTNESDDLSDSESVPAEIQDDDQQEDHSTEQAGDSIDTSSQTERQDLTERLDLSETVQEENIQESCEIDTIPAIPSQELTSTPQELPQLHGWITPRRQRRLSGCSNASVSRVRSTGSAAQGFLATPKRLQRSRQSSPHPMFPATPGQGILSPAFTPNHDSTPVLHSFLSGLSMSQSSAQRLSVKRTATPNSAAKKRHRMGF